MMASRILKEKQSCGGNPSTWELSEVKTTKKASQRERFQRSSLNCCFNNVIKEEMEIVESTMQPKAIMSDESQ